MISVVKYGSQMKSTSDDVLIARYLLQSDFGYFLVPNVMTVRIYRQISPTKRFSMIRQIGLAVAEGLWSMAALIACSQILTGGIIGLIWQEDIPGPTVNHSIINNTLIH